MGRLFAAVYSEVRGLHQSAYILAIFSFVSQLLALIRDRLLAHTFGAGTGLDLYYAAFKIPDLLFVLFASVLSVYVLVPFIASKVEGGDEAGARHVLSNVFTAFCLVYVMIAAAVFVFARPLSHFFFPGFTGTELNDLTPLLRILLIQPFLLGVSGLWSVATQLGQRFVLYAISPVLYNLGIIFGVIFFFPLIGFTGLVWGVVVGAALHAFIQLPFVAQSGLMPRAVIRIDMQVVASVLTRSLPRALTLSLNQLVLIAYAGMASIMAAGSLSIMQFALNLQSVPLAVIGVSYSVAAFPILSHLYSRGERAEFAARLSATIRHLFFWTMPAIALVVVLRAQIVRVVLGSGAFSWDDTRLTAATLALFVLSLAAQSISLLLVRAFYAAGNTRTPFLTTMASAFATLVTSLGLYILFVSQPSFAHFVEMLLRVEGVPGTEILVLPLGYSIVQIIYAITLLSVSARDFGLSLRELSWSLLRSLLSAFGGAFIAYIGLNLVSSGIRAETFAGIFLQGLLAGLIGMAGMVALLRLMKSAELMELWEAARRKLPGRIIPPDEVDTLAP